MQTLVEGVLSNAIVALMPAIVAIVVGLCCRRPAVVHALWLLVFLKLLTPPLVRVNLPWPAESRAPMATDFTEEPQLDEFILPIGAVEELPFPEFLDEDGLVFDAPVSPLDVADEPAIASPSEIDWPLGWLDLLVIGSLAGSLAWFALATRRAWLFSRELRFASLPSQELLERIATLSKLVGLTRPPQARLVPGRLAPMVWGTFQPVLLVPAELLDQMDRESIDTLLVHELAHIRRCDHWVRALEFVALMLFWWHPLVWYARRDLRQAEEQCCDAWVVRVLPSAARIYAVALVDALDFLSTPRPAVPPLACGLGEVTDLKRRLKMILNRKTPHAISGIAALGVLTLGLLLLPVMAAVSRADEEEQQVPGKGKGVFKRVASFEQLKGEELEQLQKELKAKMDEIERIKKRFEEAKKAKVADKEKDQSTTVVIQISGISKPEDIEKLTAQLKKLIGKDAKVMIVRSGSKESGFGGMGGDGFQWKWTPGKGSSGFGWGSTKEKELPKPFQTPKVVVPPKVPPTPPMAERRMEGLEKKLEAIMRELEELRKEMKEKGRGPGARGGFGRGSGTGGGGSEGSSSR